uniref:Uncharacterized protein n=1 Tax=Acrobeloides nanus TaxID=290746 RepID=A0A914D3C1_9BILA
MKETVFQVAIEECASKARKNVPLKNEPLRKRIKSKSVAGKDEGHPDVHPECYHDGHPEDEIGNPTTSSTRSYYKSGEKKEKNRLFFNRAEQTAPLAKAEDDDLEMDIVTKTLS